VPARVFRNTVENTVQGHTMILEKEHLCGGCYTEGWTPPASIASGSSGGWQSESCGFMTGTQGWVKYRLRRDSDGANRGLIYTYWTNPYLGVTRPHFELAGQDVVADCDEDEPGAGSSFGPATGENAPPSDLSLDIVGSRRNGDPATADELTDLIRVAIAPLVVLTTSGIWERMEITYRLRSSSTPAVFPAPKPRTRSLETKPDPATFTGTWTGSSLSVSLSLVGPRRLHAYLMDRTQALPLELDVSASLGAIGAVRPIQELSAQLAVAATDMVELRSSAALAALSASLYAVEERPAGTPVWMAAPARRDVAVLARPLTLTVVKSHAQDLGIEMSPDFDVVAAAVAERANEADYMLHLGSGVVLYLIRIEEEGTLVDYQLHYQRVSDDGAVLVDTDLTYLISLH
jgi:hypothetical protein